MFTTNATSWALPMSDKPIDSLQNLRKLIAEPPALMKKRLQTQIDEYCLTIIEHASICAVGFSDSALNIEYFNIRDTPALRAEGERITLLWPSSKPLPTVLQKGLMLNCSLYFIMPGIGFALRANGRASVRQDTNAMRLEFHADALFLHCSRAKVRAQFWQAREQVTIPDALDDSPTLSDAALRFITASPYLLMLTQNDAGATEISPRGDPDGFVLALDRQTLLIPERPGNKVACSLRNILLSATVNVSLLMPGCSKVLSIAGRARLTADQQLLKLLAISGKVPVLAIILHIERVRFQNCPELLEAGLWHQETHLNERTLPSFSKMLSEHMNGKGLLGKATTLVVDAVVKHDLKHLY